MGPPGASEAKATTPAHTLTVGGEESETQTSREVLGGLTGLPKSSRWTSR